MSDKKEIFDKDLEKVSGGENEDYNGDNPAKYCGFHIGDRVSAEVNLLGQGTRVHYGTIVAWSHGNGKQFDLQYGGLKVFPMVSFDESTGKYTLSFAKLTKVS